MTALAVHRSSTFRPRSFPLHDFRLPGNRSVPGRKRVRIQSSTLWQSPPFLPRRNNPGPAQPGWYERTLEPFSPTPSPHLIDSLPPPRIDIRFEQEQGMGESRAPRLFPSHQTPALGRACQLLLSDGHIEPTVTKRSGYRAAPSDCSPRADQLQDRITQLTINRFDRAGFRSGPTKRQRNIQCARALRNDKAAAGANTNSSGEAGEGIGNAGTITLGRAYQAGDS